MNQEANNTNPLEIQTNPATVLIAYHANCIDGFTAAWVAATQFRKEGRQFDLLPMEYNPESTTRLFSKLAEADYLNLYVLDFSLDLDTLEYLEEVNPDLMVVVIDHHKSAFEQYAPDLVIGPETTTRTKHFGALIVLNNGKSGACMTYDYFNVAGHNRPPLVTYTMDYDLWQFKYGDTTRYVNAYLNSRPKTLVEWDKVHVSLHRHAGTICDAGKIIYLKFIEECQVIADLAQPVTIDGMTGLVVEAHGRYASKVGEILAGECGTFGATFWYDEAQDVDKWALRSKEHVDVSRLASRFGGGGHKNAAGFEVAQLDTGILLGAKS